MAGSLDARARGVFDQVVDRSGPDRALHIQQSCDGDPTLRARVEALLAAAEKDDEFLRGPTLNPADSPVRHAPGEQPGTRIGPYTLVELIGEGGFGSVFMARQSAPVQRDVALKIIKAGMDSKQVIARFEAERQALALMDHPNIARVLEAGATEYGRPYFVMELVRGEAVTHFCDREQMSVPQRLELFRDICAAVQHAHQKGIIHRDLKPSNILVSNADGAPRAKVIDFGIAKATAAPLTERTLTGLHQLVGTPEYMSPEQVEGRAGDIDTRSDIYSLGVLLYELLTGTTPFDRQRLASSGFDGMRRILRDEEPLRPSVRLQTPASSSVRPRSPGGAASSEPKSADSSVIDIAGRRRTAPAVLARTLRRDLDWIALKCLEKDRSRRYETASALADDIGRYLDDQPVVATPPSAGYRLRKFMRRNRGAVIAGAVIASTLLIAAGVSISFGLSAQRAEGQAKARADELEQVAQFQEKQLSGIDAEAMGKRLRDDLLSEARQGMARASLPATQIAERQDQLTRLIADANLTSVALHVLDENIFERAIETAETQFENEPVIQARLFQSLATSLTNIGHFKKAEQLQSRALAMRRVELGGDHPDTIRSISGMSDLLMHMGRFSEAETFAREQLERTRRTLGADDAETLVALHNVGIALLYMSKFQEAEQYLHELVERSKRRWGPDHPEALAALNSLAGLLNEQGRCGEAQTLFQEAYERSRQAAGVDDIFTLRYMNNLALSLEKQDKFVEAEALYGEALERSRRTQGAEHHQTLLYASNLGFLSCTIGKLDVAYALTREALDRRSKQFGEDHWDTMQSMHNMGIVLQALGDLDEAEQYLREAVRRRRRNLGDDHWASLQSISGLGFLLRIRGQLCDAELLLREALVRRRETLGEDHADTIEASSNLGDSLLVQGNPSEAIGILEPAERTARRVFTGGHSIRFARFLTVLGRARAASAEFAAAEANLTEARAIMCAGHAATKQDRIQALTGLVELYDAWHAANPGGGFDQRANEWREKRREWQASTQPATPGVN